jgi:hypothetical protein
MATDGNMGIAKRYQYLRRMQEQYQQADRRARSQTLDAMMIYAGMHRKALIRTSPDLVDTKISEAADCADRQSQRPQD